MIRRLVLASAAVVAGAVVLAGCAGPSSGPSDGGKVSIVASTDVYGDIARTIGGSAVHVTSVIDDPDKDPHEYEADARTQLAIARAQILIENGGGYDDFMDTMRRSAKNTSATVLNVVGISGKDASAADFNEHLWYDYPTVQRVVTRLSTAIGAADPSAKSAVTARAASFEKQLDGLIADEAAAKPAVAGTGVAITEPVPLYMLDALGAVDRTPEAFSKAVEDGTDVPASVLQTTLDLFAQKQVAALVYNAQTSGPQTEAVVAAAKKAGIAVVPVTETLPKGAHYISWQKGLLDRSVRALES